jgi:hypothetical protein
MPVMQRFKGEQIAIAQALHEFMVCGFVCRRIRPGGHCQNVNDHPVNSLSLPDSSGRLVWWPAAVVNRMQ